MPGLQRSFSLCIPTLMTPPVKYYVCLLAIILGVAYLPPSLLGHGGRSFPKCSCVSMRSKARQRRCYLACRTHVIRGYLIHTYDMPEGPSCGSRRKSMQNHRGRRHKIIVFCNLSHFESNVGQDGPKVGSKNSGVDPGIFLSYFHMN